MRSGNRCDPERGSQRCPSWMATRSQRVADNMSPMGDSTKIKVEGEKCDSFLFPRPCPTMARPTNRRSRRPTSHTESASSAPSDTGIPVLFYPSYYSLHSHDQHAGPSSTLPSGTAQPWTSTANELHSGLQVSGPSFSVPSETMQQSTNQSSQSQRTSGRSNTRRPRFDRVADLERRFAYYEHIIEDHYRENRDLMQLIENRDRENRDLMRLLEQAMRQSHTTDQ